jgi:hypothetical protein
MEYGMKFLEEAINTHNRHLNENSRHRWMKAIYLLADFKRTGILSLRSEKRGFVFSEPAGEAFRQYTAYQSAVGLYVWDSRKASAALFKILAAYSRISKTGCYESPYIVTGDMIFLIVHRLRGST